MTAIALLLLIAAAFAWQQQERDPTNTALLQQATQPAVPDLSAPLLGAPAQTVVTDERSEAAPPTREAAPVVAMANNPQGLRGLVVDVDGRPLPTLTVYMAESASNEPFAITLLQQQRHAFAPLATTETAADGTFAIGLPIAQNKVYELYVVSPTHATARLGGLRLLASQWHDLGTITMVPGGTLRGRVTVAGRSDIPVPQALVTAEIGSAFADAALRGLPGTTPGLSTTAAADGTYELRHVPSRGVVQVAAVAQGFARVLRSDIQLLRDEPTTVDFGLPPGLIISGVVIDANSAPLAGARIEAWPQKSAGSALIGRSDNRGNFVVAGLIDGPYRVRVSASGFQTWQQLDVPAGQTELRCALVARSRVSVRATTPSGQVVRNYRLGVRRFFRDQGGKIGGLPDVPDQQVRLDGFTDRVEVRDLPAGILVCEVEADGFAKTLSPEFDTSGDATAGATPREHLVDVILTTGGTVQGIVVDENGQPLANATVVTMGDGLLPDSPLQQMLAGALPERISVARVATRADGRFTLRNLALADYQLLVEHPDACRTIVPGIHIGGPEERQLPPIQLLRGTLVTGRVTRGGANVGQAKVVLSSAAAATGRAALRLETATDATGGFTMPRRVPPGNYDLRAAVIGTTEPEAQIFQQLLQLQRSATTVSIAPGQGLVQRDIDLPTER